MYLGLSWCSSGIQTAAGLGFFKQRGAHDRDVNIFHNIPVFFWKLYPAVKLIAEYFLAALDETSGVSSVSQDIVYSFFTPQAIIIVNLGIPVIKSLAAFMNGRV